MAKLMTSIHAAKKRVYSEDVDMKVSMSPPKKR